MASINDKVRLSDARGGWDGFVSAVNGGPDGRELYHVVSINWGSIEEGSAVVDELDIASTLSKPTFSVNDSVTLYGQAGTVTVDNGDDTYEVTVENVINEHLTVNRTHTVQLWQLGIENGE